MTISSPDLAIFSRSLFEHEENKATLRRLSRYDFLDMSLTIRRS